jgi:SAM-dependent methyltransferase
MPLLRSPAISAIYGAEPCHGLHAELRKKAAAEGLAEKYTILPCGVAASELIPALRDVGVSAEAEINRQGGVFDTIICVRVLCSIPEMDRTVRDLYSLLKPGGRLLVTEHVVNPWRTAKGSLAGRFAQAVYQLLGWSWYIGDCHLDRDTEKALRAAAAGDGGWESVQLERDFEWSAMPYIAGTFVKKTS